MLDRSLIRTFIDGALSAQIRSFHASGPLHSIDRPVQNTHTSNRTKATTV